MTRTVFLFLINIIIKSTSFDNPFSLGEILILDIVIRAAKIYRKHGVRQKIILDVVVKHLRTSTQAVSIKRCFGDFLIALELHKNP